MLFSYHNRGEISDGLSREAKASVLIRLCVEIVPFVGLGRWTDKPGIDLGILTKAHVNIGIGDWPGVGADHVRRERWNAVCPHGTPCEGEYT